MLGWLAFPSADSCEIARYEFLQYVRSRLPSQCSTRGLLTGEFGLTVFIDAVFGEFFDSTRSFGTAFRCEIFRDCHRVHGLKRRGCVHVSVCGHAFGNAVPFKNQCSKIVTADAIGVDYRHSYFAVRGRFASCLMGY